MFAKLAEADGDAYISVRVVGAPSRSGLAQQQMLHLLILFLECFCWYLQVFWIWRLHPSIVLSVYLCREVPHQRDSVSCILWGAVLASSFFVPGLVCFHWSICFILPSASWCVSVRWFLSQLLPYSGLQKQSGWAGPVQNDASMDDRHRCTQTHLTSHANKCICICIYIYIYI